LVTFNGDYFSMQEIAEIIGGEWVIPPVDASLPIKHYAVYQGELSTSDQANLFFAMDGPTWVRGTGNAGMYAVNPPDSHKFVHKFANQLRMIVVQRLIKDVNVPQLEVANSYEAMKQIFALINAAQPSRNIGITGTVGKSTMKALLTGLLKLVAPTHSTPTNHNSRTSARITVMNSVGTTYNVLEIALGAFWYGKKPKQVGIMQDLVLDLGIITQVGIGQRGYDEHAMAEFKTRLAYGLKPDRPLLVNGDIKNLAEVKQLAQRYTSRVITYGMQAGCDYIGQVTDGYLQVRHQQQLLAAIDVRHFDAGLISNAIGAISAMTILQGRFDAAWQDPLHQLCQQANPRKVHTFMVNGHQVTVLDDTHNAEVLSMQNFIDFAQAYQVSSQTQKVFVMGRVINLGDKTRAVHLQLIEKLMQSHFDQLYTFGPEIGSVAAAFKTANFGGHFDQLDALSRTLIQAIRTDTVIFIKGSGRNSGITRLAPTLVRKALYYSSGAGNFAMTQVAPSSGAYTQNGVGRVLVILACLEQLSQGKLHLTDRVTITQDLARDHSQHKVDLTIGDQYTLFTLLNLAIVVPAPDVIVNLAEFVYGDQQTAKANLVNRAQALGLSAHAFVNVTGRPMRQPQQTYLSDLEKIGAAFTEISDDYFELLSLQRAQLAPTGPIYQKYSRLLKTGQVFGSLFFGVAETNGLLFLYDGRQKQALVFLNATKIADVDQQVSAVIKA